MLKSPLSATQEWKVRRRKSPCLSKEKLCDTYCGCFLYIGLFLQDNTNWGYGDRTMKMIEDENVDLVVDVGDFEYWGRCTETYEVKSSLKVDSLIADTIDIPHKSILKRIKWQDGRHKSIEGWEIGVQSDLSNNSIATSKKLTLDGDLFQRHVITDETWGEIEDNLKLQKGERDCYGEPWDGTCRYWSTAHELLRRTSSLSFSFRSLGMESVPS